MPTLGVVVPALNAAPRLAACLALLRPGHDRFRLDIVVADAGSSDDTAAIAAAHGARVIQAARGRGSQIGAGTAAARGDWLLVLHADTLLPPGWPDVVAAHIAAPANAMRAGYGRLRFDDPSPWARLIEHGAMVRSRWLGLPYGDQGLLLPRALLDAVGGYPPWPLMEDVGLVRRIGRRCLAPLGITVTTSADRYRRDGWLRRPLRNLLCLALFFLGVKPERILRVYTR